MSAHTPEDVSRPAEQLAQRPAVGGRLGYLLKHAQLRLAEFTAPALAPFGITGRELAVLITIDDPVPQSQQDVAGRLGVDRTTMVALIDTLQDKGLVERLPDPADRRRNVIALTGAGTSTMTGAIAASDDAERRFLSGLSAAEVASLRAALRVIAF